MLIERLHNVEARVETSVISTLIFFGKIPSMARKHGKQSQDKELEEIIRADSETEAEFQERRRKLRIDVGYKHPHLGKNSKMMKAWHGDDEFFVRGEKSHYALWYEFLRDAHFDENVKVDYKKYEDWALRSMTIQETLDSHTAYAWAGKVFKAKSKWRDLFGVSRKDAVEKVNVSALDAEGKKSIRDSGDLLIRVRFTNKSKDDIDRRLRKVLREEMQRRGRKSGQNILRDKAKYELSGRGFDPLTYRRTVEVARLEKRLLEKPEELDFTTYFDKLNKNKRKRKSRANRRGVFEELFLAKDTKKTDNSYKSVREMIYRDRARYKKTLASVAAGSFP